MFPAGLPEERWPINGDGFDVRIRATADVVSQVRQALADLRLPSALLDDARLLLGELLANSIRHAGLTAEDQVRIRAQWSGTRLRVEIWERAAALGSAQLPVTTRPDPDSESGWGLYLVDTLASRWGSAPGRYWFELEDNRHDE